MASTGRVSGAKELASAFRSIGRGPTAAQRRKARQTALEPIKRAAVDLLRINNSVVTGALIASMTITESNKPNTSVLGQRRGKVKGLVPSAYAHLVEFAVRPHYQPNRFGGIMHPGHPGYPFMRPAYEQTINFAGLVYLREIAAAIEGIARTAPKAPRRSP